ncbi:hypothetical protein [Nonomuraea typhae]|uniref:Uncharacterized protein n=1 Tax=Nonomuraea typhae TaxID=2603600 RepID=A0ABW7YS36_9ACTN
MTAWYLRWLLRPFFDAGATVRDVLHGLDVRPDESRWTHTWSSASEIRHVPGWVRHRLAAWIGPDGRVVALPSQRASMAAARRRAEQQARRREWQAQAAAAGIEVTPEPRMSRAQALAAPPAAPTLADAVNARHWAAVARMTLAGRGLPTTSRLKPSRRDDWREDLQQQRQRREAAAALLAGEQ